MHFLVTMEILLPPETSAEDRRALTEAESKRARELKDLKILLDIWRVPGRRANVGIWEAPDATALHEALTSLPMWPWIDAQVTALADHPNGRRTAPV